MSHLAEAGLLAVQAVKGIAFHPFEGIALVMEEVEGRLTVVLADGNVAHRPGPLSAPSSRMFVGVERIEPLCGVSAA